MKRLITVSIALVLLVPAGAALATPKKSEPVPGHAASRNAEDSSLSGKVVETMNAGGYSYICIEKSGKKTWVAVPETAVKVGQQAAFQPGHEMKGFSSKTLNRTFDSIIFSGGILNAGASSDQKKAVMASNHGVKASPASAEKISVEKAAGPDAYTVAEVFSRRAKLNNKTAVVRARVVKVSAGIMGKNWIHLQDGTGDAAKRTNNLIATSQDLPSVGDIVVMKGTLYKDKDFGAGYKYDVIMEGASIQKGK